MTSNKPEFDLAEGLRDLNEDTIRGLKRRINMICGRDIALMKIQMQAMTLAVQTMARINEVQFKARVQENNVYNFQEELSKLRRENSHLPSLKEYRAKG